jgi:site-specific recombinase XerD
VQQVVNITQSQSETSTYSANASLNHYNYTITRTWKATDVAGNSSTCIQTITVQDVTAPIITCPGNTTVNCQDNNTSAATGTATATDNCATGNVTITQSETSTQGANPALGSYYNYVITRTWKATDPSGNSSTCVQTITVQDVTAPVITCPGNTTVNCQDNNTSGATGTATATDNCATGNVTITQSETSTQGANPANSNYYNYTITRTWKATDPSGNSSTCVQLITVQDVTAPIITCPGNTTVNCQDNNTSTNTGVATATDNCASTGNISITQSQTSTQGANPALASYYNYVITRTWKATDPSGNSSTCVQLITVQDVTAPIITCPGNTTVNCQDNNTSGATGTATATDNCATGNVTITQSETSTQGANPALGSYYNYVITRTWKATDPSGNSSTCVQLITVQDVTAPIITCPGNTTVNCQDNNTSGATGTATATDNCATGNVTITQSQTSTQGANPAYSNYYNYVITRTWKATDPSGNSSTCVQLITVQDVTAPVITCPGNTTVNCQDNNTSTNTGVATATDNCATGNVTITQSETSTQGANPANSNYYNYTITRTWKATDPSGNSSTCVQTITVQDITAPIITCPANTTVSCQDNNTSTNTGVATATDNCATGNVTITQSETSTQGANPANSNYYNYTITRTWKATDHQVIVQHVCS